MSETTTERAKPGPRHRALPSMYGAIYPALVDIGREHGYAVALHGSLARDLDVIATPWVEHYSSPDELAEDAARKLGAVVGEDLHMIPPSGGERKPHGRLVYTIVLEGGAFIDMSVIPPRYPPGHCPRSAEAIVAKLLEMADRYPMMAVGHLVEHVVPEARTVGAQPDGECELEVEVRCVRSKLNTMDVAAHASMDRIVAVLRASEGLSDA